MDKPTICPQCKNLILPNSNFCQTCGFQIVSSPQVFSIWKQIWIYFVSIFLPPLGLIWTFKYFRSDSEQIKRIAFIALILTIISSIITIWISVGLINSVNQQVQQQLNGYQGLGI